MSTQRQQYFLPSSPLSFPLLFVFPPIRSFFVNPAPINPATGHVERCKASQQSRAEQRAWLKKTILVHFVVKVTHPATVLTEFWDNYENYSCKTILCFFLLVNRIMCQCIVVSYQKNGKIVWSLFWQPLSQSPESPLRCEGLYCLT